MNMAARSAIRCWRWWQEPCVSSSQQRRTGPLWRRGVRCPAVQYQRRHRSRYCRTHPQQNQDPGDRLRGRKTAHHDIHRCRHLCAKRRRSARHQTDSRNPGAQRRRCPVPGQTQRPGPRHQQRQPPRQQGHLTYPKTVQRDGSLFITTERTEIQDFLSCRSRRQQEHFDDRRNPVHSSVAAACKTPPGVGMTKPRCRSPGESLIAATKISLLDCA